MSRWLFLAFTLAACNGGGTDTSDTDATDTDTTDTDTTTTANGPACDAETCTTGQYCEHFSGGASTGNQSWSCLDFPAACATDRTCACLEANAAGCTSCQDAADGVQCSIEAP